VAFELLCCGALWNCPHASISAAAHLPTIHRRRYNASRHALHCHSTLSLLTDVTVTLTGPSGALTYRTASPHMLSLSLVVDGTRQDGLRDIVAGGWNVTLLQHVGD